ncbi:hypothetical protein DER46DRAFT_569879 [Fusarium sp. MPI-SDFR-AT-0072]|nr:hypothetical protein DER46DRAFT_569879 [Fusarium sp. MPI-SDFR-AT-0072]
MYILVEEAWQCSPVCVILYHIFSPSILRTSRIGIGLADAAWCSFIGQMKNSHEISGILQACYALGATIAPLVATSLSGDELIALIITFWTHTGDVYLSEAPSASGAKSGRMRQVLKNKLSWIFTFFVFAYCGAEVALGGWVVVFMQKRRNASAIVGSSVATGFWGGMTIGRLFLSLITLLHKRDDAVFFHAGIVLQLLVRDIARDIEFGLNSADLVIFTSSGFNISTTYIVTHHVLEVLSNELALQTAARKAQNYMTGSEYLIARIGTCFKGKRLRLDKSIVVVQKECCDLHRVHVSHTDWT